MTATIILIAAAQIAVFGAGFALLWRKLDRTESELESLRRVVEAMEQRQAVSKRTRAKAEAAFAVSASGAGADELWAAPVTRLRAETPPLAVVDEPEEAPPFFTPRRQRIGFAVLAAIAPLAALGFGVPLSLLAPIALFTAAALAFSGFQEEREDLVWVGAASVAFWSFAALLFEAAGAAPGLFAAAAICTGAVGIGHIYLRESQRGAVLTGLSALALLWLGTDAGIIGPAGAALAALVAAGAILGAQRLRFEALHLAAFAAAGAALFVLSAQHAAAIWFTPAAALTAVLFLAIAFVRTPQLGPRGGALAATGAGASLFAVGALYVSQHGLANPFAAAAGFAFIGALFAGILALSAQRRGGDVRKLKLTLWVLSFSGFAALASAIFVAAPAPLAAALLGLLALGFAALDTRAPSLAWRVFAVAALLAALAATWTSADGYLSTRPLWPRWAMLISAFAAPAACAAACAAITAPRDKRIAGVFETFAIIGAIAVGVFALRAAFSVNAEALLRLGFFETGAQIAVLLTAGLTLALRQKRRFAAFILISAITLGVVASAFWITPEWLERPYADLTPYGFALMAAPLWAHWAFWRRQGAQTRTRAAFAAAALATAAFVTVLVIETQGADVISLSCAAALFGAAIAASCAPQIVANGRPRWLRR